MVDGFGSCVVVWSLNIMMKVGMKWFEDGGASHNGSVSEVVGVTFERWS